MRELPILFSAPMVRAILEGRKTVTRRVVKPLPGRTIENLALAGGDVDAAAYSGRHNDPASWGYPYADDGVDMSLASWARALAPCAAGDRLYVRETFWQFDKGYKPPLLLGAKERVAIEFDADLSDIDRREFISNRGYHRKPSLHLPKAWARIWLEVDAVRVERLQDITYEDAVAEGLQRANRQWCANDEGGSCFQYPQQAFADLWNGLARPGARWADNPWVWVVEFRRASGGAR